MRDKDGDGDLGDDYMNQMQWDHMFGTHDWNDIAYNHAYDPDGGEFYEGRGFGIRPGAQKNHNTGTHSLVVMGNFQIRAVTPAMIEDIASFYAETIQAGLLPNVVVLGHRQAPNQSTTCPGNHLVAALPGINNRIEEILVPTYRTVQNVPDADWARKVVDDGIAAGRINVSDDSPDDWNRPLTDGRYWTFESRVTQAGQPGTVDAEARESAADAHTAIDALRTNLHEV